MFPLHEFAFHGREAKFSTPLPREEAARRLAAIVEAATLLPSFRHSLVGVVTQERVTIRRHRPFFGNVFTPTFSGNFSARGPESTLQGSFSVSRHVKRSLILVYCVLAYVSLSLVIGLVRALAGGPFIWEFAVVELSFAALAWSITYFIGRLAREDSAFLSRSIHEAIDSYGA